MAKTRRAEKIRTVDLVGRVASDEVRALKNLGDEGIAVIGEIGGGGKWFRRERKVSFGVEGK